MNSDEWIYSEDSSQIGIKKIDELICAKNDAYGKLDVVVENIVKNDAKNRFYLAEKKEEKVQKTSRLRLFAIHREIRNKK